MFHDSHKQVIFVTLLMFFFNLIKCFEHHLSDLIDVHCFLYRTESVVGVCFGVSTHHTHGLLIIQTEEFELLSVNTADCFPLRWRSLFSLLLKTLTQVPQSQIYWRIIHLGYFSTNGTFIKSSTFPERLNALGTDAVTTGQNNRIHEKVQAHGTSEVLLRKTVIWHFAGQKSIFKVWL